MKKHPKISATWLGGPRIKVMRSKNDPNSVAVKLLRTVRRSVWSTNFHDQSDTPSRNVKHFPRNNVNEILEYALTLWEWNKDCWIYDDVDLGLAQLYRNKYPDADLNEGEQSEFDDPILF